MKAAGDVKVVIALDKPIVPLGGIVNPGETDQACGGEFPPLFFNFVRVEEVQLKLARKRQEQEKLALQKDGSKKGLGKAVSDVKRMNIAVAGMQGAPAATSSAQSSAPSASMIQLQAQAAAVDLASCASVSDHCGATAAPAPSSVALVPPTAKKNAWQAKLGKFMSAQREQQNSATLGAPAPAGLTFASATKLKDSASLDLIAQGFEAKAKAEEELLSTGGQQALKVRLGGHLLEKKIKTAELVAQWAKCVPSLSCLIHTRPRCESHPRSRLTSRVCGAHCLTVAGVARSQSQKWNFDCTYARCSLVSTPGKSMRSLTSSMKTTVVHLMCQR